LGQEAINENDFLTMRWKNPKNDKQQCFGTNQGLTSLENYIGLLNPDEYKIKSQEVITTSGKYFEVISRIDMKVFNLN